MLEPTLYTVQYKIPEIFYNAYFEYAKDSNLSKNDERTIQQEAWNFVIRELHRQLPKFSYDERLRYHGLFSVTSTFPIKKGHTTQIVSIIQNVADTIFRGYSLNIDREHFINSWGQISDTDFYDFIEERYYNEH